MDGERFLRPRILESSSKSYGIIKADLRRRLANFIKKMCTGKLLVDTTKDETKDEIKGERHFWLGDLFPLTKPWITFNWSRRGSMMNYRKSRE